jgi:hypothetical protein
MSDAASDVREVRTGGCQCGAVRFRVEAPLRRASICHCRMCQKATGGFFGAYASFPTAGLSWTRGQRRTFRSSDAVVRGFCGDCGTPLTFEALAGGEHIGLAIGAFDDPAALAPQRQLELAARLPWFETLAGLPTRTPAEEAAVAAKYGPVVSRQHPDHDTDVWPPAP